MEEINKAIGNILEALRDIPLSSETVDDYRTRLNHIGNYCKSNGIILFSHSEAQVFTDSQTVRVKNGHIGDRQFRKLRRSAYLLADCMQGKDITWGSVVFAAKPLCEYYATALKDYESYLKPMLATSTIRVATSATRQFLYFLEGIGINRFSQLAASHVKRFIQDTVERCGNSSSGFVYYMRKFIAFLNETNLSMLETDKCILRPASSKKKALPCFTAQEAAATLSAVDSATPLGKRDYAIIKLAMETGLRGVDVFGLRLKDINWRKNEITLNQSKTGEAIQLPLMADVGNAIADYILHARPKSDSPHVFLRSIKPYVKLGNGGQGRNILGRYFGSAGIAHEAWDGKTFHAYRRTQGTRLLEAGVPLPSVAAMLGQVDINSPKRYISNAETKMRECCLDISGFATQKEELS